MRNPFPGMDPFLEGPSWASVHGSLVEEITRQLAGKLWPNYLALPNERIVLAASDEADSQRMPDVGVFESNQPGDFAGVATMSAPLVMRAIVPKTQKQKFVEIRDANSRRLVTTIELLSPTNKHGDGLTEYGKKRRQFLTRSVHFVEIDLLRAGERFPVAGTLPSLPYFVFISRVNRRPKVEIWPIALDHELPKIPIPLRKGDPDAILDLQTAFQTVYDVYHYDYVIDHSGKLAMPLSDEQMSWVQNRLQSLKMKT